MKIPATNKEEATAYLYKYISDKVDNKPNPLLIKPQLFKDFAQHYLEISKQLKNETTYDRDLNHLKVLLDEWGSRYLHEITSESIEHLQVKLLKKGLSRKTVNNRISLLSTMLRMAQKQGLLAQVPAMSFLKLDKLPPKYFTDDEINDFLTRARPLVRDMALILLHTGFRLGELQRLQWSDVDLRRQQLTVRVAKSHKFRAIGINETLHQHLIHLRQKSPKANYVFEKADSSPYSCYSNIFQDEFKKLGIKGHAHKFRHTFASRLVQKQVSIYLVKELLGHSSVQTTQIYAHLNREELKKAVCALDHVWDVMV